MASVRWGGLRPEPYDPDAVDADNDGIVQEGTAWERPAGTRILDELGREIVRSSTRTSRPAGLRYVDRNGKDVHYVPRSQPPAISGGAASPLQRVVGVPSLREQGRTLEASGHLGLGKQGLSLESRGHAPLKTSVGPIGEKFDTHVGDKQPALTDLGHAKIVERLSPSPAAPSSGTPGGIDPRTAIEYDSPAAEKTFGPLLDEIAQIHGLHRVEPTGPRRNQRGELIEPRERRTTLVGITRFKRSMDEDGAFWRHGKNPGLVQRPEDRPIIEMNSAGRGDPKFLFQFSHEVGHRVDCLYDGSGLEARFVSQMRKQPPEMTALLQAATVDSPHWNNVVLSRMQLFNDEYQQYLTSAVEVWARIYSQWLAYRLEERVPQLVEGLDTTTRESPHYTWPRQEFEEKIAPLVESVLRARGLIV